MLELPVESLLGPRMEALSAAVRGLDAELRAARTDVRPTHAAFVALRRQFFPDGDPRASCLVSLLLLPAQDYANSGFLRRDPAMQVFEDFVDIGRACPAMHPARRAFGLWWCSRIPELSGRFAEGEAYAREGLREVEAPLGTDHWMVANLRKSLGVNLVGQGQDREGERMLVDGYEGLMSAVGPDNGNTEAAFESLVDFEWKRGDLHEASRIATGHLERLLASGADPARLDGPAWCVVVLPGMEHEAYEAALRVSNLVIASGSYKGNELNTLGAGQYRLGRFREALDTLLRSTELGEREHAGPQIYDSAFLAMTHARLGNSAEAAAALARAREILKDPVQASEAENQALVREAGAVVEGQ